jgi:uncharacterized protein (TIGR00730 family)
MTKPSLCVFCGARSGKNPAHALAAKALGAAIARNGWRLVYGAGDVGLMGKVAAAAIAEGGRTLGVIPIHLLDRERAGSDGGQRDGGQRDGGQTVVTEDMHERKKVMFMNSDAVAVLPGGAGSLDEFFEVLTWAQIGLHAKPVFLVDVDGYWQPLLALLDHIVDQGFADNSLRQHFRVVATIAELWAALPGALNLPHQA